MEPLPTADAPPPTPEDVFRDYAPRIYTLARRLVGNDADAQDVTSDVLLQVVRKLHTFRGEAALPTWLHRVTVNAALALREKRGNRAKREQSGVEQMPDLPPEHMPHPHPRMWSVPPDASMLAMEDREKIEQAIGELPEMYRDAFVLADVEGLPNAEAAEMLGLNLAAFKSRLHRARLMMRDRLARHFEESLS